MPIEYLLLLFRRKFGGFFRGFFGSARPANTSPAIVFHPDIFKAAYVKDVCRIVENHLAEADFRVNTLCRECHVSQPQLYRKLKAQSGLSPVRLIRALRLQKAKELLWHTDLTIAEIAYETGFTSPTYFTRLFVKTLGLTPSEYRKNATTSADE